MVATDELYNERKVNKEIGAILTRLAALEQFAAKIQEVVTLHIETLNTNLDIIGNLERRLTKIEKATSGEWVRPGTRADYVDVTEGSDDIPVGADG